ncbi:MAG TPA: hypothetical protein VHB79_22165 [Polyangiaceae bacterium]|nr:hypothetical protein [Polyangiaceae bacterium]
MLTDLDRARSLTAELRLQFDKADKATSQAVMADTDEASIAFAKEAQQATAMVASDVAALGPLLTSLGYTQELEAFAAFQSSSSKYLKLDQDILALAVENTNLKAQRMSFGPARQAADAFRDAISNVAGDAPAKDRCGANELAQKAIVAVREIQVLQAPHIAEADDQVMTRLEQDMAALEQKARDSLTALSELVGAAGGSKVALATASLDRFKDLSGQIVSLSRRNTNVRSLALSLREQTALAAACDSRLRTLQQALDREGSKATR